jgi:hypothetical protein
MNKEKLLNHFIFDTLLFYHSGLTEIERVALSSYMQNNKNITQIGLEIHLTDERVRQIIENAMSKIFKSTKHLINKNVILQKTLSENRNLKDKLNYIAKIANTVSSSENEVDFVSEEIEMQISDMPFSVRAKNTLAELDIITVNQLSLLKKNDLYLKSKAGVKTVDEIIRRAEEIGIKIK